MKYDPEAIGIIPAGTECFAEVMESVDHTSKEGKESIKITFGIWEDVSMRCKIPVYITPKYALLFKHAIVSMIGEDKFKSGEILASDFVGKKCNVVIGVENSTYQGRDTQKNIVVDIKKTEYNKPATNEEPLPF